MLLGGCSPCWVDRDGAQEERTPRGLLNMSKHLPSHPLDLCCNPLLSGGGSFSSSACTAAGSNMTDCTLSYIAGGGGGGGGGGAWWWGDMWM